MLFTKVAAVLAITQVVLAAPQYSSKEHTTTVSKHHGNTKHHTHHVTVSHGKHKKTHKAKTHKTKVHKTKAHKAKKTKKTKAHKDTTTTKAHKDTTTTKAHKDTTTTKAAATTTKAASTTKTVTSSSAISTVVSSDFAQSALDTHNKYRAKHHVDPLKWSDKLAADALKVAKTCVFEHQIVDNEGQCLAMGWPTVQGAVEGWYSEVKDYNYSKPGFSMSTGHFTQVVWKSTTEVGCASNNCPNNGGMYIVCNYNPSGNYLGEFAENVFPP